jgi:Dolichyl-phosphate-mannose-protein mannosyltransferase
VKTAHPDLANPPVYPLVLAGLMKILPFHFAVNLKSGFWANNGIFWRYQPDFLIAVFNEVLLLVSAVVAFFVAKKLFDSRVAWLALVLMLGCEVLWRFSVSGLSTMLLLLIFLALAWCILKTEELGREPQADMVQILFWAAAAGILTGVGALTRYSFGWTIIPVVIFLLLFSGPGKLLNTVAALAAFAIVLAPWIVRNLAISGVPFGTAGYAIFEGTSLAPGGQLDRSLHPDLLNALLPSPYGHKLLANLAPLFAGDLFKLGGSWLSVLFFAGLLLGFSRSGGRRMRYFLMMCLGMFMVVQALGRTWLSDGSPEINSENLLVLVVPLVFIFGAAFFFTLLDQMTLPAVELRYVVIGLFIALCCLPLFFAMWSKARPVQYPPYYPPDVEKVAGWMKPNELMMSDVPWAVAWYGQRQCAWITEDANAEFFALNDYIKPVNGLYLTMRTMDSRLVSDCFRGGQDSWGRFTLDALARNQIPAGFPLHRAPSGSAAIQSGMFLTDAERWKIGTDSTQ